MNAVGEGANSAVLSVTPNAPASVAVNSGAGTVGTFAADNYYDTGTAFSTATVINTNGVINPAPMPVYQSQRYGNLTYTIPYLAPNSAYKVRLHFAETYWTGANQ